MSNIDLEDTITTAVDDALDTSAEPVETPSEAEASPAEEAAPAAEESTEEASESTDASIEVASPAAAAAKEDKKEDFSKRFGIDASTHSGRENRIPYSRVKKIVEKAEKDTEKRLTATHTETLKAEQAKVTDYETRLKSVGEFERLMVSQPQQFLDMLRDKVPGYRDLLSKEAAAAQSEATAANPDSEMPQPDSKLADGSMVYSLEGLKALLNWNAAQVEKRVSTQFQQRFGPIESEWQASQRVQALIPQVQREIDEARKWPQFKENEEDITKALQANPQLSLEGAYRQVVLPKLTTSQDDIRASMRKQLMEELKRAPKATSAPTGAVKPGAQAQGGHRDIEDIIKEQLAQLR